MEIKLFVYVLKNNANSIHLCAQKDYVYAKINTKNVWKFCCKT